MKYLVLFLYIFVATLEAQVIDIAPMYRGVNITSYVHYYQDKDSKLTLKTVHEKKIHWQRTTKESLDFGYSFQDTIWLYFQLYNNSNKPIIRVLEFDNVHIGEIVLYDLDLNQSHISGYNHQPKNHTTLTYPFYVMLNAYQTKEYIVRVRSTVTPLNIELQVWKPQTYIKEQIVHQVVLALFFGGVFALLLYNLSLFFFVKDRTYLYYCAYLAGMILHTLYFTGFLNLYVIPGFYLKDRYIADTFIYLLIIFIAPFVRNYLHLQDLAPKIDKILYYLPHAITVVFVLKLAGLISTQVSILLYLLSAPLMLFIGGYSLYIGVREAYYFLAGWSFMIIGMLLMALYTTGVFSLFGEFPYVLEVGYFLEAILFSIGLAARINTLKKQKIELEAKQILFKELHHRVKNNLQMVISLLRLQSDRVDDKKLQDILLSAQNRINAISNLHKLLYQDGSISYVDTKRYFEQIIQEIKGNIPDANTIQIALLVTTELSINQAVYCGLILNELITNALKYAFTTLDGHIKIALYEEDGSIVLEVVDNGVGFQEGGNTETLGLLLVKTLSKRQLSGTCEINSKKGTKVTVRFTKV